MPVDEDPGSGSFHSTRTRCSTRIRAIFATELRVKSVSTLFCVYWNTCYSTFTHMEKQRKKDSWKYRDVYRSKAGEANLRVENNRRTRHSRRSSSLFRCSLAVFLRTFSSPLYSARNRLSILLLFTAVRLIYTPTLLEAASLAGCFISAYVFAPIPTLLVL